MATPNKNTIAPLGSTERTNQLLGGNYFDTKTGKQTKAFTPTINTPQTTPTNFTPTSITSNDLKSTPPLVLPRTQPTIGDAGGIAPMIQGSIATQRTASERENQAVSDLRNQKNRDLQGIIDLQEYIGQEGRITERAYQRENVDKIREEVDNYTNQLEAEDLALRRKLEDMDKNPQGLFGGALQQEKERVQRESLRKQADIAILQNSSLRRYDTARDIADRKVKNELEPLKARLDTMKFIYGENKEAFNTAEKRQYESIIREEERTYATEKINKEKGNEYIINALQGGAPKALVAKAQELYNSGASYAEIANTLGSYSLSASDRLDLDLKRAQLNKIRTEISETGQKVSKEQIEKEEAKLAQIPIVKDKINLIKEIKDSKGLNSRVGVNLATRRGFGLFDAFGAGQDFAGAVQQLTNSETLNELLRLKASGGTLGAVSEKELDLLQKSASKINAWEVKDKDTGLGKGEWNIDEATFKRELDKLLTSAENLYKDLGGVDDNQNVDEFVNSIDSLLKDTNTLYQQSGYSL